MEVDSGRGATKYGCAAMDKVSAAHQFPIDDYLAGALADGVVGVGLTTP